jgi:hypothetical protein
MPAASSARSIADLFDEYYKFAEALLTRGLDLAGARALPEVLALFNILDSSNSIGVTERDRLHPAGASAGDRHREGYVRDEPPGAPTPSSEDALNGPRAAARDRCEELPASWLPD